MTRRITAIKAMQAKIRLMRTATTRDVINLIKDHTGLSEGEVRMNIYELRDAIIYYARQGSPTKIEGLGTFTPTLRSDGKFHLNFRPDVDIKKTLNRETFYGRIDNKRNRGKSGGELVELWNQAHPDDPVD